MKSAKRPGEPGIKLGISRTVTGRRKDGPRVKFMDTAGEYHVTETIVVRRAKRAGYKARRLPSGVWGMVAAILPRLPRPLSQLTYAQVAHAVDEAKARGAFPLGRPTSSSGNGTRHRRSSGGILCRGSSICRWRISWNSSWPRPRSASR